MALPKYKNEHVLVNVKRPVYALLNTESETSAENVYSEVKAISPLMSVNLSVDTNSEILYGDGSQQEDVETEGPISLELGVNTLSQEFLADARGHKYENGVLIESKDDLAPYLAMGFAIEKSNGKIRAYWLLKGKVDEPGVEADQKEDNVTFSTPTVNGSFIYRKDGHRKVVFDEEDENAANSPYASWEDFLSAVPTTITTTKTTG